MTTIQIPRAILSELKEHAQSLAPIESCGYLSGNGRTVTRFHRMTNIDNSPEHFTFDPKEQFAVLKDARNAQETLVAVYHSHPESPARLSEEDIRLFNDPNMVYIIVSLMLEKPDIKAFTVKKEDG